MFVLTYAGTFRNNVLVLDDEVDRKPGRCEFLTLQHGERRPDGLVEDIDVLLNHSVNASSFSHRSSGVPRFTRSISVSVGVCKIKQ